jgi:hypothetical protein
MRRTLLSVVSMLVFVGAGFTAVNAQQLYDFGKGFSMAMTSNGDVVFNVPLSGNQLIGSDYDKNAAMDAKRFPSNAQIVVMVGYTGTDAKGKKLSADVTIPATVKWMGENYATVTFKASAYNFVGKVDFRVTPKVPGYNRDEGEAVFIWNYKDAQGTIHKDPYAHNQEHYAATLDLVSRQVTNKG